MDSIELPKTYTALNAVEMEYDGSGADPGCVTGVAFGATVGVAGLAGLIYTQYQAWTAPPDGVTGGCYVGTLFSILGLAAGIWFICEGAKGL